jgi:hypothetical protein
MVNCLYIQQGFGLDGCPVMASRLQMGHGQFAREFSNEPDERAAADRM